MTSTAVSIAGLVKRYGGVTAVDGLDLTVEAGTIFGLLGPNGAGKTTTIETLVGLRTPTAGRIRVLGHDAVTDRAAIRRAVAVQPQQAALFPNLTAAETVRLWASLYERPAAVGETLDAVGLGASAGILVRRLSGGQQRRLLVATALVSRPRLLVLDEPSLGLDPNARADVWDVVLRFRDAGGTVLLSTNSMEEAEALCDRLVIVVRGRPVATGTTAELVARYAPGQVVTFTRDDRELDDRELDDLRALAGVVSVRVRGSRVHVTTEEADLVTAALSTGPAPARGVSVRQPGLDDVFRALTNSQYDATQPPGAA